MGAYTWLFVVPQDQRHRTQEDIVVSNADVRARARAELMAALESEKASRRKVAKFLHKAYRRLRPIWPCRILGRWVCRIALFGPARAVRLLREAIKMLDADNPEPAKKIFRYHERLLRLDAVLARQQHPTLYYEPVIVPDAERLYELRSQL